MRGLFKVLMLLVLANVVVFLWPSNINQAPHVHSGRAELNPHFVRLNKEIEDRFYSHANSSLQFAEPEVEIAATQVVVDVGGDGSSVGESGVSQSAPSGSVCYRLGPFMHNESYELAQAVLFNADVEYQKSTRKTQESDVFRLYLGPFSGVEQVTQVRAELKRKLILDHFSRKQDDGQYIISLGIYSSEESAEAALRLFQREVDAVKMQSESVVLPNSYWLHFVLVQGSGKFEQLSEMNWGENSVKLGPHTCRTQ